MRAKENPHKGGPESLSNYQFSTHAPALPNAADLIGAIPAELKALPQWVCWRLEERDGNQTKVPYNAKSGRRARSNDPATWTEFGTAMDAYRRSVYSGVGFMF